MPDGKEILAIGALALMLWSGGKVVHGVKVASIKTKHAVVHVAKKLKPRKKWFHVLNGHEEACARVGYCDVNSGTVVIGDVRCYTQNVNTVNPIDNKDLIHADGTACSW